MHILYSTKFSRHTHFTILAVWYFWSELGQQIHGSFFLQNKLTICSQLPNSFLSLLFLLMSWPAGVKLRGPSITTDLYSGIHTQLDPSWSAHERGKVGEEFWGGECFPALYSRVHPCQLLMLLWMWKLLSVVSWSISDANNNYYGFRTCLATREV